MRVWRRRGRMEATREGGGGPAVGAPRATLPLRPAGGALDDTKHAFAVICDGVAKESLHFAGHKLDGGLAVKSTVFSTHICMCVHNF